MLFVPVVDKDQKPLMPTTPARAAKWIKSRKATPFWKRGVFCVRLNVEPSDRKTQPIAVGIDPGSKKEGFTVKAEERTFLNIQADAVTHVSQVMQTRRVMRKKRRSRKTPYRKVRFNRARNGMPPSTKARWDFKFRVLKWLNKIFPISIVIVEDIKASSKKGKRRWNQSFSPLQLGKSVFYTQVESLHQIKIQSGYDTKVERDRLGLTKTKSKLSEVFEAHCVDSWVLANSVFNQQSPDNKKILFIKPFRFHRRQLHAMKPNKKGKRRPYGSTRSKGFTRGSLVNHTKYGLVYIGGSNNNRITLHQMDGKVMTMRAKPEDCRFRAYLPWTFRTT